MSDLSAAWRRVLSCRSVRDKLAIPIDCDLTPVECLPAVSELVRGGYMVWLDRCGFPIDRIVEDEDKPNIPIHLLSRSVNCDIYLLTPKGAALCDEHGIKRH